MAAPQCLSGLWVEAWLTLQATGQSGRSTKGWRTILSTGHRANCQARGEQPQHRKRTSTGKAFADTRWNKIIPSMKKSGLELAPVPSVSFTLVRDRF